jgi:membrane-associated phospholipid phosphatase
MMSSYTRRNLILASILAAIAIALSIYARWMPLFPYDVQLVILLQSYASEPLTALMVWISRLFDDWYAVLLVILAGLLVWWKLGRLPGIMVYLAGLLSLFHFLWKEAVGRPRPSAKQVYIIDINHDSGFPSGHSFFAIIFLGFLAYLVVVKINNRTLKAISFTLLFALILLVGFSRMYLGAHWPSDVLGGYVSGSLFLVLLIWIYERTEKYLHQ